ncbi:MAG: hypothetical protein ACK4GL_12655 [Flavobacteriales bacterium]
MKFITIILSLMLIATGCSRKLRVQERVQLNTAVSDCTIVNNRLVDVPVSIPADSAELAFTIATVIDEETGRVTIVPMQQRTQSGRAKATTTIDKYGNISTQVHCDGVEKQLQIAVKDKERYKRLYESAISSIETKVVITRNPWWIIPLIALCVITAGTIFIHKFIKPFKFIQL